MKLYLMILANLFACAFLPAMVFAASSNCLTTTTLGPNQTITSSLDGTECTINDIDPSSGDFSYFDLYKLTLSSVTTVTISMDSSAFDTYLVLFTDAILTNPQDPSAYIADNDDADTTSTNSRITVTLGPGTYIVLANSFFNYETGGYLISSVVVIDTDKDGIPDHIDPDDDNDGMPDTFETQYNLNPLDSSDADADADGDGYSNLKEFMAGTDPRDPNSKPSNMAMPWLPLLLE